MRQVCAGEKKPPEGGFSLIQSVLQSLNRFGLGALQAFSRHVRNALVFFERFEARTLDVGVVHEQVFATRFRLDEAKTFFIVEPLDDTGFCLHFLQSLKINGQHALIEDCQGVEIRAKKHWKTGTDLY
jgi:hypothetical protein